MPQKYLKKILNARVYDVARETPLDYAPVLSQRLRNQVWLKREDEQPVFSFKCRGAYNKMAGLSSAELKKGVITASAGNHAQGVALAARKLGTHAVIVMPRTTPQIKVDAVRNLGGRVVLHGDNYDAAYAHARELEGRRRLTFVHPYDDPEVIAGQGTIGFEILKQHTGDLHAVFVPVGGRRIDRAASRCTSSSCGRRSGSSAWSRKTPMPWTARSKPAGGCGWTMWASSPTAWPCGR